MNLRLDFSILDEKTPIHEFDCGEAELNYFLKNLALLYQNRRFGVTMVFSCREDKSKTVIAYYTLCPASIQIEDLPEKFLSGPKPNPIPAFRLCRLAVDKSYQGKKIGSLIFVHALKKCLDQANQIGGNAVIIDAKNENAKAFYEHFGFISLPQNPLILIQSMKFIHKHFTT